MPQTHLADRHAHDLRQRSRPKDALVGQFYLDGEKDKFASRFVSGNVLTLKQEEASATQKIKEVTCSQDNRLIGANGRRADLLRGPAPVRRGVPLTEVGHDNFIVAIGPKKG